MVPGGLLVTPSITRLTPFTSLMMRVTARPGNPMSKGKKSEVMPSTDVTALSADVQNSAQCHHQNDHRRCDDGRLGLRAGSLEALSFK